MEAGSAAIGGVLGGTTGAGIAVAGDRFNRQLHQDEVARIKELAGDDPKRQAELIAASCALVKCSSQYEVGTEEYTYWVGIEALGSKPEYQQDREWLASQTNGELIYTAGNGLPVTRNLFDYGWADATTDWGSRNLIGPRVAGGLQTAGGLAQVIGGIEACGTLLGCAAMPFLVFSGYDNASAGFDQLLSGKRQNTWGGSAIQKLGFEPETAELIYGMTQLAPTAIQAVAVNRGVNLEIAANAWVRGTYTGDSFSAYSGDLYRYTRPEYAEKTWEIYAGNVAQNHRYSPPGVGAIYAGTTSQTAAAEIASYSALEGTVLVSRKFFVPNVLDLTDSITLKALGLSKDQITNSIHGAEAYVIPQRISGWARGQGYEGILAPSAQRPNGVNMISFDDLLMKGDKSGNP